jgi:predicted acylesterase/phospholipase RssA
MTQAGAGSASRSDTLSTSRPSRWALVLSGGAARGLAHVGVLRALAEERLVPDVVIGTSMGSMIGALHASGYSSQEMQAVLKLVDWQSMFDPDPTYYEWRATMIPRPWFTLFGPGRILRMPPSLMDDAYLNHLLVRYLLDAEALAQGDFDRLPIPWRAVATDLATLGPVVASRGSVARAVRSSISIPLVFPALSSDGRLLVDGGWSSHLPVHAARAQRVDRVLAVDVALPTPVFDQSTSAVKIGMALLEQINRRVQGDSLRSVDRLIRVPMPNISAADFLRSDSMIAIGYREARPIVEEIARTWKLPHRELERRQVHLPPLADIVWVDERGRPARRSTAARALLGRTPSAAFRPTELLPGLERVYRGDLFVSAWPRFRSDKDSTLLQMEVREHGWLEAAVTGGYDNDADGRLNLTLTARPWSSTLPDWLMAGITVRRFRSELYGSLEPRALSRGANGWFVRGGALRTDTRLFAPDRSFDLARTERREVVAGVQVRLATGDVAQGGAGWARIDDGAGTREAPMAALRIEAPGRVRRRLEAIAVGGDQRYASLASEMSAEVLLPRFLVRPTLRVGYASRSAPLDEHHGLGGPATLGGMRHQEWLGRRVWAADMRLVKRFLSGFDAYLFGQIGEVHQAVSRSDLSPRPRVAGGLGLTAAVPFGPLTLDWGMTEGGTSRLDFSIGQEF